MTRLPTRTLVDALSRIEESAERTEGAGGTDRTGGTDRPTVNMDEFEATLRDAVKAGVHEALDEHEHEVRESADEPAESDESGSSRTPSARRLLTGAMGLAILAYVARRRMYGATQSGDPFGGDVESDEESSRSVAPGSSGGGSGEDADQ